MILCVAPALGLLCAKAEEWTVWAAWAQGLGSVGAIFVAIAIAYHQRRALIRAEQDAERTTAASCVEAFTAVRDSLNRLAHWARFKNGSRLIAERDVLADVITWAAAIEIHRIPIEAVPLTLKLRKLSIEGKAVADSYEHLMDAWPFRARFERARDYIDVHLPALADMMRLPRPPAAVSDPFEIDT